DQITIGGTIAGMVARYIVPELMSTDSRLAALVRAALAAALGYAILWIVLGGGKIDFGKKRVKLDRPAPVHWTRHGADADHGVRGVLFSIFAGSVVGSVVGLATLVIGKRVWSAKLPFGPYLAFGALTWMFFGEKFIQWYLQLVNPV